jgi:hypothetical protein
MEMAKLGVSARAVIQRINRKLKPDDEVLKAGRGRLAGQYYIINFNRNWLVHEDVDLEALGRELGALEPWEKVIP